MNATKLIAALLCLALVAVAFSACATESQPAANGQQDDSLDPVSQNDADLALVTEEDTDIGEMI